MSRQVDRTIEGVDTAMRQLRESMRGIPIRSGSFGNTYDRLRHEVGYLVAVLDASRSKFRD